MSPTKRKPKPKTKRNPKPDSSPVGEIEFSIKPGTKTTFTLEAGKERAGKIPVKIRIGEAQGEEKTRRGAAQGEVREDASGLGARVKGITEQAGKSVFLQMGIFKRYDLAGWLLVGALVLYLVTRLVGLTQYPLYFFVDEAFQSQTMQELIAMKYRDVEGTLFPAYFGNGMGLTVYLQWLPLLLFGKSALVTRAVSAIITVIAAIAVGVILRDIFKVKYWWSGVIFLSITPAWFLHSRTAFETAVFVSFYAVGLCAYLLYRSHSPRYLYLTLLCGALAFYSYNPGQLLVPVTAIVLLISDWRYHWENRSYAGRGAILLAFLAIPYIRYRIDQPSASNDILHLLGSYLVTDIPLIEKIKIYLYEYSLGLGAWYWYVPNTRDQIRHVMKDYGHIMIATLPLALLGLATILMRLRDSASRAILLIILISPVGAAMVQIGITRTLLFVIPAAILTAIGFDQVLRWIERPREIMNKGGNASSPTLRRVAISVGVLLTGVLLAFTLTHIINSISVMALAAILGIQGLGVFQRFGGWLSRLRVFTKWEVSYVVISLTAFTILAGVNIYLLTDALRNGPLWTKGQYGELQYGSFQIYDVINEYHQENPEARIIFTSSWANGADVLNRFFIGVEPWLDGGTIDGYLLRKFPLDANTVFVMVANEFAIAQASDKLTDIRLEKTVTYPDGSPAFYFVRLRYVDNIDEIFAAERAVRAVLREATTTIDGQEVTVRHSYLDAAIQADAIQYVFDNDSYTLAKTFEDNPFIIELVFPSPRVISGFSISIHSATAQITLKSYPSLDAEPITYTFEGKGSEEEPVLSFELPQPVQAQWVHLEMYDPHAPPPSQVHIWELKFQYED